MRDVRNSPCRAVGAHDHEVFGPGAPGRNTTWSAACGKRGSAPIAEKNRTGSGPVRFVVSQSGQRF